jgi:uncharacterized protein (DUF2267 family)
MGAAGLGLFDTTLRTARIWLDEVADRTGDDRDAAWEALTAVLHEIRDCLPLEIAVHLGAQLPLLVRGAYYDRFDPMRRPAACDRPDRFLAAVGERLASAGSVDAGEAVAAVFALLDRHLGEGQLARIRSALPKGLCIAWDGADARLLAEAGA